MESLNTNWFIKNDWTKYNNNLTYGALKWKGAVSEFYHNSLFFSPCGYKNTPIDKWNIIAFLFSLREGSWCFDPSKGPIDQHEGKLVETISAVILILPT